MKNKSNNMVCFSSIELFEPKIENKSVKAKIVLNKLNDEKKDFIVILKYDRFVNEKNLPLFRLAFIMPLLNYGLFSHSFKFYLSLSKSDIELIETLNIIFSKDIFINKILKRRANYILPEYILDEKTIITTDSKPKAKIQSQKIHKDSILSKDLDNRNCGILSSGGKESLLTYGLLKEIGCNVFPLYINESGGHWRTALPAYRYHLDNNLNTQRVWTNIDRFYNFMLDNLRFIRPDHRKVWADTYPIRLCIFPYYVFALLPIFIDNKIGNLLIGSEFDDLRETPRYHNIKHYYGVYDQHQDFDILMNKWYEKRIPNLRQWSAVGNISGLIVERILVNRYPYLAKYQRSCHSCHIEKNEIVPCGICSKCMGVLLFLLANKSDPKIMNFKDNDIKSFRNRVKPSTLRLDQDEKDQSFYLIGDKDIYSEIKPVDHVEKIHINTSICNLDLIPNHLRKNLLNIIQKYTTGYCELKDGKWISMKKIN